MHMKVGGKNERTKSQQLHTHTKNTNILPGNYRNMKYSECGYVQHVNPHSSLLTEHIATTKND